MPTRHQLTRSLLRRYVSVILSIGVVIIVSVGFFMRKMEVFPLFAVWESITPSASADLDAHPMAEGAMVSLLQTNTFQTFFDDSPLFLDIQNSATRGMAWGDMDGDGDLDLAAGNTGETNRLYINNGDETFTASALDFDTKSTQSVAWGDMDGDGDLDLAVGNGKQVNQLYQNKGGQLTLAWQSLNDLSDTRSIAWGDWDGDGDLDLAVGNYAEPNQIYENAEGQLQLLPLQDLGWQSPKTMSTWGVAWGDADGDGDLDLAIGNYNQQNQVYRNDGNGQFAITTIQVITRSTTALAWGDADGDGDLDLAIGNFNEPNQVLFNLGREQFLPIDLDAGLTSLNRNQTLAIAWGDVDSDGDLDIVAGTNNRTDKIYLNNGAGDFIAETLGDESTTTWSVAWGDFNNNGNVDLALGTTGLNRIHRHRDGLNFVSPRELEGFSIAISVAWGDIENDGDLDLALATGAYRQLMINDGKGNFTLHRLANGSQLTEDVELGDMDGDGDLDLAYSSSSKNQIYRNNGNLQFDIIDLGSELSDTGGLAWGDMDNDGDLDLAVAGSGTVGNINQLFRNDDGVFVPLLLDSDKHNTRTLAWGDIDGDGDLDLAAGNGGDANRLYINHGNGQFSSVDLNQDSRTTNSIAWGDIDGDGDLDLAVGNSGRNQIYRNLGNHRFSISELEQAGRTTTSVVLGDVDGDGDLDLAAGNSNFFIGSAQVYLNDGRGMFTVHDLVLDDRATYDLDLGDMDGDGDLDLATAHVEPLRLDKFTQVHENTHQGQHNLPANPPSLTIQRPITAPVTSLYVPAPIVTATIIPITYRLTDHESDPVGQIEVFYSLNSKNDWHPAIATRDTLTTNLATSPGGVQHVYYWDTFASGFFGQSDNVVVQMRIAEQPTGATATRTGVYSYLHSVAGPYQSITASAVSPPFRVRSTQIQVVNSENKPMPAAQIYQLAQNSSSLGQPILENGLPAHTAPDGYLSGRGELHIGDHLIATAPITFSQNYTVYHTNVNPFSIDTTAFPVENPGVQRLVVSADHPLILFNLTISLEWDARKDLLFLEQLEADIERTAQLLYDWSNGQATLGEITVHHDKAKWLTADIRIHATNNLRPSATVGGIVPGIRAAAVGQRTVFFTRGQVEMGATWNRYGEAGANLGEDWARTLAHELGHYLFYLLDNYVGINQDGQITNISQCPGAMSNPYEEVNSEFHPVLGWLPHCEQTLAQRIYSRSDWETIDAFYPRLHPYDGAIGDPAQAGPNTLPLAVTQIYYAEVLSTTTKVITTPVGLDVPIFSLSKNTGEVYLNSGGARAFLFHGNRLLDLGAVRRDRLQAWNATPAIALSDGTVYPADRICVYDLAAQPDPLTGCQTVTKNSTEITVSPRPGWYPDVIITPQDAYTVAVQVKNLPAGLPLQARLYPANDQVEAEPSAVISLTFQAEVGAYTGMLSANRLALDAYVHIYVKDDLALGVITHYTLGGAPTLSLSDGDTLHLTAGSTLLYKDGNTLSLSDGDTLSLSDGDILMLSKKGLTLSLSDGDILVHNGSTLSLADGDTLSLSDGDTLSLSDGDTLSLSDGDTLSLSDGDTLSLSDGDTLSLSDGDAPIRSGDGQVTLFISNTLNFDWGEYYTLQPATVITPTLPWKNIIGQGYRVTSTPITTTPSLKGSSITFNYLGREIDEDKENLLRIYYFNPANSAPVDALSNWRELPTTIDTFRNIAIAEADDVGLYALMYSIDVPIYASGWNLIAYPVQISTTITDGLRSIEGVYSTVYHYNSAIADEWQRWQVYDVDVPSYVNTLRYLEFGRGYWISVTKPITLQLQDIATPPVQAAALSDIPLPPAFVYGQVSVEAASLPAVGQPVRAWIDGHLCGESRTRMWNEQIVYAIAIPAESTGGTVGCGAVGRRIHIEIDGQMQQPQVPWHNHRPQKINLQFTAPAVLDKKLFLPLIMR